MLVDNRAYRLVRFALARFALEIAPALSDVRFWGQGGHRDFGARCLLLTQSGHQPDLANVR
jgi:hypothetical protein